MDSNNSKHQTALPSCTVPLRDGFFYLVAQSNGMIRTAKWEAKTQQWKWDIWGWVLGVLVGWAVFAVLNRIF